MMNSKGRQSHNESHAPSSVEVMPDRPRAPWRPISIVIGEIAL